MFVYFFFYLGKLGPLFVSMVNTVEDGKKKTCNILWNKSARVSWIRFEVFSSSRLVFNRALTFILMLHWVNDYLLHMDKYYRRTSVEFSSG